MLYFATVQILQDYLFTPHPDSITIRARMPAQNNTLPFSVRRSQKLALDDLIGYIDNAFRAQGKRILLSTDLDLFFYTDKAQLPGSPLKVQTNQYGALCLSLYLESVGATSFGITTILNQFPTNALTVGSKQRASESFPYFCVNR
jgi:hypothetical protein